MTNRVLAHTGAKFPIVQAPMGWIARTQLASAVSKAGGLGVIETSSGETENCQDAAAAVAELILFVEHRATQDGDSVATVGQLLVPNGSTNVVPGRCHFTLDMRAPNNAQRDALVNDILSQFKAICERRQVRYTLEETMRASAAPSSPAWQKRWESAVDSLGLPLHRMPSGAGHDAMKLHEIMPQAMLFVRGENSGISHNPLESSTNDDMQLAVDAFSALLDNLAKEI